MSIERLEAKCGCCRRPQHLAKSAGTGVTFRKKRGSVTRDHSLKSWLGTRAAPVDNRVCKSRSDGLGWTFDIVSTIIYFPAIRTLHTGDLMAGSSPLIDYPGGGSVVEWIKTLDAAMKLDFDTVIPGHGPVTTQGQPPHLSQQCGEVADSRRRAHPRGQEPGGRRQGHDGRIRLG